MNKFISILMFIMLLNCTFDIGIWNSQNILANNTILWNLKRPLRDINRLQAPTNLTYDNINNRLNWTLSPSPNVINYLVYKKGSDNIWKSVADSGGLVNSTQNYYNIQTSGFNYYKIEAITASEESAFSDPVYVNQGYTLKKQTKDGIVEYKVKANGFNFKNEPSILWTSNLYTDYNKSPYPKEMFQYKQTWINTFVPKIYSGAFPSWKMFTHIFGNNSCYDKFGDNPPQEGDEFNNVAVQLWYEKICNNNIFYDILYRMDCPGVCVGFVIASALSFANNDEFYNQFPFMKDIENINKLTLDGNDGSKIRNMINHLGAINYYLPLKYPVIDPSKILETIINELSVVHDIENQYQLALGLIDGKNKHCIFPYKVEQNETDENTFYIYIYDCDHPNDDNRKIIINKTKKTFKYENYKELNLYINMISFLGIQNINNILK